MQNIIITATGTSLRCEAAPRLIAGTVGDLECDITLSDNWTGLSAVAVFSAGDDSNSLILTELSQTVTVPWEVLQTANVPLSVGVYGYQDTALVRQTTPIVIGMIHPGTDTEAGAGSEPTPSQAQQIMDYAAQAAADAADARTAAENAESSGEAAVNGANGAAASASAAATSANNAAASAASASSSAATATASESNAAISAANAVTSANAAANSATAAAASELNAAGNAESAAESAESASGCATAAAESERAAADSASAASDSAREVATSERNAAASATEAAASAAEIEDLTITVETLDHGSNASVEKTGGSGTPYNLAFGIPRGDTGNGIESIELTDTTGLVDTYTITMTNGTTATIPVAQGKGISSIAKTATAGLVDTYTVTYNDGTTTTYTVTNGADGLDLTVPQTLTTAQQAQARQNINALAKQNNYELVEKIIVGYGLLTSEPDNWSTNWTAYYTNTGTATSPTYTAVTGDTAPAWAANTYYSYDSSGLTAIERTQHPNGTAYDLTDITVKFHMLAGTAAGSPGIAIYNNSMVWQHALYVIGGIATGERYSYVSVENNHGFYKFRYSSVGSLASWGINEITSYNQELIVAYTNIGKIRITSAVAMPSGSEIYIYGVRA